MADIKKTSRKLKAPKKPKNQPMTFQESVAAEPLHAPVADVGFAFSERQQRWGLIIVWIVAMILVGVAIGWRLVAAQRSAQVIPGNPVADNAVDVAPLSYNPAVALAAPFTPASLVVTPASAATQAGAGTPLATVAIGTLQPADGPDSMRPGYQTELTAQGNLGTDPVR